jgi:putative flavoprotein involved in K+ transport
MSRCLSDRAVDHVILERGRVAERWRSERWDSLRLLTPNWQSRLPGWSYQGTNPDGYMTMPEIVGYLEGYAQSFAAPVRDETTVLAVEGEEGGYRIDTNCGSWRAKNVVIATGYCDIPYVPDMSGNLSKDIVQLVSTAYRNPGQLPSGGVLVVGASSTGIQLADEIHNSGRAVTLAVGRHTRLPRTYRGVLYQSVELQPEEQVSAPPIYLLVLPDLEVRPSGSSTVPLAIPGLEVSDGTTYTVFAIGRSFYGTLEALPVVDAR